MSDLIDTTEMYLRTIYELSEEGVTPLRARIAERLRQSGPTVSQTVARMERDGLVKVHDDRHLALTVHGQLLATRVMRRHRLVERLLVDVIGLDPLLVHEEACRWEHVVSTEVEKRLLQVLDTPRVSPYGNPIPALEELGVAPAAEPEAPVVSLAQALAETGGAEVTVARLTEHLQGDAQMFALLVQHGVGPGTRIRVRTEGGRCVLSCPDGVDIDAGPEMCERLFVVVEPR